MKIHLLYFLKNQKQEVLYCYEGRRKINLNNLIKCHSNEKAISQRLLRISMSGKKCIFIL
jgi:hypothetical protein